MLHGGGVHSGVIQSDAGYRELGSRCWVLVDRVVVVSVCYADGCICILVMRGVVIYACKLYEQNIKMPRRTMINT